MHDGITFEELGKPALVLCTHPFEVTGRNIARALGCPDYAFALVDHPIGSRPLEELQACAADAYDQGLTILLVSGGGE
ncbi:MAG: hypothetical protein V3U43_00110 [Pseudomonadales bacterium]